MKSQENVRAVVRDARAEVKAANKFSPRPFMSVVIPMYNVEDTIRECLDSVLAQTLEDFEVICVDDGGQDNTLQIVEQYTDPRIRIISQKNRGLAGARNTGIHAAKSPFIALLDSDDLWHHDKLEKHFQHLCANPHVGVSYSGSAFIDENSRPLGLSQTPKLQDITPEHVLCRNPVGNGSSPVIRKHALQNIAFEKEVDGTKRVMYFNEGLRQSEDIELWVRMALNTRWAFEGIGENLTYYRVNGGGLSANLNKQYQSWKVAMEMNYVGHETFFDIHLPLAKAYQKRYLARRAIESHKGFRALSLMAQALSTDIRIVKQEPVRTAVTAICACLATLPGVVYDGLQTLGIKLFAGRAV